MKKFFLVIIIIITSYILIIFKLPELWANLGNLFWTTKFNEFLLKNSDTFNNTVTDIPSKEELINTYSKAYSWAIKIKDTVVDSAETIKGNIDDVRVTLSWAESKINNIKDKYKEAKDFIETNSWKIQNIQNEIDKVSKISKILTSTWDILNNSWKIINN